jgi:hypothetical protein
VAPTTGPTLTGWPRQIDWSEFQEVAQRPPGEKEDAQISSNLEQPAEVGVARQGGRFRLSAYEAVLSIDRLESWVVGSTKSDTLLAHEQGHYDITGVIARDLVRDLRALRATTTAALERDVKATIRRADDLAKRLNKLYDDQTKNSRDRDRQQKWEALIRNAIDNGARLTAGPQ